jgi:hypothetical protein
MRFLQNVKIFIADATPGNSGLGGRSFDLRRFLMSVFKLPLSGEVTQWINPITSWFSGNQISVNLGEAGSPETEAEILRRVGSYGRQLGKITDAMVVLMRHLPKGAKLTPEERDAVAAFKKMADDIADIKETHKRQAMRL